MLFAVARSANKIINPRKLKSTFYGRPYGIQKPPTISLWQLQIYLVIGR